MLTINQDSVLIGANKQPFGVDYSGQYKIVAYGAKNNIALWEPNGEKGVYNTLNHHSGEVSCVRFIPDSNYLVTGGEDHEINIWQRQSETEGDAQDQDFELVQSFSQHKGSITCMAVGHKFFITGASDGEVIIWHHDQGQWSPLERFSVQRGFFPLSLALQEINPNEFIISIGGTNSNLYIYSFAFNPTNNEIINLNKSAVLTGHEDWIKCLTFIKESDGNYLLASGSQDRYIRLWRLRINEKIDNSDEDNSKLILLSNKQYKFNLNQTKLAFSFEALIVGHDDWITGLSWQPKTNQDDKLQLLSSSADTALMIWEMDFESGIWICVSRIGELSIKGASTATGASGGFWSVNWYIDGDSQYILTNGKTGSIRKFKSSLENNRNWESILGITGPIKEITDIVWSKDSSYIMATSLDQTTRLVAPWNNNHSNNLQSPSWYEFARPQIHGYDMICLDNINSTKFVSGGDEKILRVFEMTKNIKQLLEKNVACKISNEQDGQDSELPDIAALPVLGLSNKSAKDQLEAGDVNEDAEESEVKNQDIFQNFNGPPLEDHLQRFTLFPEVEKLYGHGYEIANCVVSPNGKLIATSCKCNTEKHGMIRIFNIDNDFAQCEQTLPGHSLTITNLEFSTDGKYLLSVSRDRQYLLWEVIDEINGKFKLIGQNPKAHTRIIWDSCWLPLELGYLFVTGSRDKSLKLWKVGDDKELDMIKLPTIITSVSSYPTLINGKSLIAIGLDNGDITFIEIDNFKFSIVGNLDARISPSERISVAKFSGKYLAVGSSDSSIRIYNLGF